MCLLLDTSGTASFRSRDPPQLPQPDLKISLSNRVSTSFSFPKVSKEVTNHLELM